MKIYLYSFFGARGLVVTRVGGEHVRGAGLGILNENLMTASRATDLCAIGDVKEGPAK